jgi:5-methylcytosine-specific restriction enzyme A
VILQRLKDRLKGKIVAGEVRSSQWPKFRKAYITLHPTCEVCKSKKNLEVHHIVPFNVDPTLELDYNNLITLCEGNRCHLRWGHLDNYRSYNSSVVLDAWQWKCKIGNRPKEA